MTKQHLKGYSVPTSWPIKRKRSRYVMKPRSGPHKSDESIILNLLVTKHLRYAKTAREVRKILNQDKILVNKKAVRDPKYPIGIFDILEIPETKESYKVILDENKKFKLEKLDAKQSGLQLCKIRNKTLLKGKKIQLNLSGGKNIIIPKDTYKVGDSVVYDLDKKAISKHLKFEKGAKVYLAQGKFRGKSGELKEVNSYEGMRRADIKIKTKEGEIKTLKEYAIAIE